MAFQHWSTGNGLPSDSTSCALEDREGNIWIGTDIGGLARLGGFAVVNYGTATGLPSSCVFGMAPGPEPETLWIATMRGAALCRVGPRPEVLEVLTTAQGLNNDWIWKVLLTPQKELWVLTDFSWQFRRPGQRSSSGATPWT
jgi:ligand-binding sensor domain-containing protein